MSSGLFHVSPFSVPVIVTQYVAYTQSNLKTGRYKSPIGGLLSNVVLSRYGLADKIHKAVVRFV